VAFAFTMIKKQKILVAIFCVVVFLVKTSCIKRYNAGVSVPSKGYLVVEGFINSDGGPTTVYLSRTLTLSDTARIVREQRAQVSIQGENNVSYPLTETSAGIYTSTPILLNNTTRYRLHIKTFSGQPYNSDYSEVHSTPAIDSVLWKRDDNTGVQFFVNAHDPQNKTRYYLWKWNETWEYNSPDPANLKFTFSTDGLIKKAVFFDPSQIYNDTLLKCWHTDSSTNIIIGSSEKLSADIIDRTPLSLTIAPASEKLAILYSLNLKQYALSKNAYLFYQLLQKNTEQLGSIFDAQPSQITGNIHSVLDSTERVIGFVEVTQEIQKRIFIDISDVPNWGYKNDCIYETLESSNDSMNLNKLVGVYHTPLGLITNFVPTTPNYDLGFDQNGLPTAIYMADPTCVYCTLKGGTNKKPSFWP
jgi:hypothetical protein